MPLLTVGKDPVAGYRLAHAKPQGPITIDRSDQFGRNVIRAFVPQNGAPVDLITGPLLKLGGAKVKNGLGQFPGGANEYFQYREALPTLTEFTIIFRARRNSTSLDHGVFSDKTLTNWASANGVSVNFTTTSSRILFLVGTSQTSAPTSAGTTEFVNIACVWKAGSIQNIYEMGVESTYVSHTVASSHTVSPEPLRIGSYYDASTIRVMDGDISYLYMLDVALTPAEIIAFHLDPYRAVKPAVGNSYFFPSVGGSITPSGLSSAEAFGTAVIGRGAVSITPNGIASAEAFGTAVLSSLYTITANAIATAEAFGTAVLSTGAVSVLPSGIATTEAIGAAVLSNGFAILPLSIESLEALGNPVLTVGNVTILPAGIASSETIGAVIVGDVIIVADIAFINDLVQELVKDITGRLNG